MILYLYLLLTILIIFFIYNLTVIRWHFDFYRNMETSCRILELFKLRYNLYKYLMKDDFVFNRSLNTINFFKNAIYIIIIFFLLIFFIGFEYLNFQIIFFIIILITFIYNIEMTMIKLDEIRKNPSFNNYSNYYKTLNKIFNKNYEYIQNINNVISYTATGFINKVDKTFGGLGYIYNQIYTLTASEGEGSNFAGYVKGLKDGSVSDVFITNVGSGYTSVPSIEISVGGTLPATFTAEISTILINEDIKELSFYYKNLYEVIRRNAKYIDDVLEEDLEDHLNLVKKENDLLKYVDIYDYEYIQKFLILDDETITAIPNIITTLKGNNKLINLDKLEEDYSKITNNEKITNEEQIKKYYSIITDYLGVKDLKFYKKKNDKIFEELIKILDNFNIKFFYLLINIILIFMIILHIFFINLFRYL